MASSNISYDIRLAKESDFPDIVDHFRKHFFKDAPLANYFRLVTDKNPVCEDFEAAVMKCLDSPSQNLVAIHDGKIIGACLNEMQDKDERETFYKVELTDERVKVLGGFMKFCTSRAKLFDQYPDCKKAFLVDYLSVDRAYRGCGVAKALITKTMELAKQFGCGVITANCASLYSALAFENLGYEMIFEQTYQDYIGESPVKIFVRFKYSPCIVKRYYKLDEEFRENERIVLKPKEPHKAMKVYARRVV